MKLVSMLNPAGAVVQAIIATYNTITFFIEKINQIAAVVASFIDSISAIAAGQVANAAKKVEATMANTLVVVIAFLAKFAGLGNIPNKVVGIVKKIRQPIDKGLDKIVGWLGKMLEKAKALFGKKDKDGKPGEPTEGSTETIRRVQEDLKSKSRDLDSAAAFKAMISNTAQSHSGLKAIRVRRVKEGSFVVEASASPFTFVGVVNELVKTDYGYVVASVALDDVIYGQPAYNGEGLHAEDKIIGFLNNRLKFLQQQGKSLPKKIEVYVSQSPCKKRCTPNLIQLKGKYPTIQTWVVYFSFEYAGTSGKKVKESQEARVLLQKKGFHVLQFDEALEMEKQGKAVP
jgi:hypothetical protein